MVRPRLRSLTAALVALAVVVVAVTIAVIGSRHDHRPTASRPTPTPSTSTTHLLPPTSAVPTPTAGSTSQPPGIGGLVARAQREAARLQAEQDAVHLTVANFNALGASHTAARGKDPGMASGSVRGAAAGRLLLANHVDVASLQEFQQSQAVAFEQAVGSTYDVWPGASGGPHDGENSVAWRSDRFTLVKSVKRYYPYFYGRLRLFPLVLLRDKATGIEFWMTSYHNPANTAEFGNQAKWKHRAVALEIPDISGLLATSRLPLIVAGDMNDRAGFFCPVVAGTGMHAANGGSSTGGVCNVPPPSWIDWILGSPEVSFTGYRWDHDAEVRRTSDHPLVLTEATIQRGAGQPK